MNSIKEQYKWLYDTSEQSVNAWQKNDVRHLTTNKNDVKQLTANKNDVKTILRAKKNYINQ